MDLSTLSDRAWERGRLSLAARVRRLRSKLWMVGQCAVAAAVAWEISIRLLHHSQPLFAPLAAVICLGTSYAQRLRRVVEVSVGVAMGIGIADLFVDFTGRGVWQIAVVIVVAMSAAILLDAGVLLVGQAAGQAIVVATILPLNGSLARIVDALVGGGVALVGATIVPSAPLRRPREEAAKVVGELSRLMLLARQSALEIDEEKAAETLDRARETELLLNDLRAAAAEGMEVVRTSPFRRHTRHKVRTINDVVKPLDRAIRNTRVLVRRVEVSTRRQEHLPADYLALLDSLAEATEQIGADLAANKMPDGVQPQLITIGETTVQVSSPPTLTAAVILGQLRSIVIDLLQLSGMTHDEAISTVPERP